MSKPYDAATKDLMETDPSGWVEFLGCPVPRAAVSVVDADVSTVTAEADKVIRVEEPSPWILHLELQSSRAESLGRRLLRYNGLLHCRHELPVASVALLLRRSANIPAMQGELRIGTPIDPPWSFRYVVVRVLERRPEEFLNRPLGLLPLAPLARVDRPEIELPRVIDQMRERIEEVSERSLSQKLWIATYVLMGLRYNNEFIDRVLHGVRDMEESVTYQAVMKKGLQQGVQQGELSEARRMLLLFAQSKLGVPGPTVGAALDSISDVARIESLASRVLGRHPGTNC